MIWLIIYLVGVIFSGVIIRRMYSKMPDDYVTWSLLISGLLLSWVTVITLIFAGLTSYNQLEWEEETQEELDQYMAKSEERVPREK